jgi:hypothetical protein
MIRRNRLFLIILSLLLLLLTACGASDAPEDEQKTTDTTAASIARLCEDMQIDERHAAALVDLFSYMNLTGEVLFAYPAEDDNGIFYYHVWIGDKTANVYMRQDGTAQAILVGGTLLYGKIPEPSTPEPPSTPDLPGDSEDQDSPDDEQQQDPPTVPANPNTSIVVLSHAAKVAPGEKGHVRATGEPGVEYKIKVYYASGVSTAKALSPQVAGEDGSLFWEWTVNSRVKPGVYKIIVVRADNDEDAVTLPFEVTENS